MTMPKFTKRDKRNHAEIKMDELIDQYADNAETADDARVVLGLMKQREEINNAKKPKIDPAIVNNLISVVGIAVNIAMVIKAEKIDCTIPSKGLMSLIPKGRLR